MRSNGDIVQKLANVALAKVQVDVVDVFGVIWRALLGVALSKQFDQTGLAHIVSTQQADLVDVCVVDGENRVRSSVDVW